MKSKKKISMLFMCVYVYVIFNVEESKLLLLYVKVFPSLPCFLNFPYSQFVFFVVCIIFVDFLLC